MKTANPFWEKYPWLCWSNPATDDSVRIRAALLRPRFSMLLDIAVEFGLDRLRDEWAVLQADDSREVNRARQPVKRIFGNIEKGIELAASQDLEMRQAS